MAKGMYIGVSSKARKVKKIYIGVGGVARKVKKAYIGVGGVARLFWSGSGEVKRYGTATNLGYARMSMASSSVGDYAVFMGGYYSTVVYNLIDAYNHSLTRSGVSGRQAAYQSGTKIGNYAIFGGGAIYNSRYGFISQNYVDTVNSSLTYTAHTSSSLRSASMQNAATSIGNYALIGGGSNAQSSSTSLVKYVNAYNSSITRTNAPDLTAASAVLAAASIGDYALFGGGSGSSYSSTVDAYNSSLTKSTATSLVAASGYLAAASNNKYAIFGGGSGGVNGSAYNSSLTRTTISNMLAQTTIAPAATSVQGFVIFGGGQASGTTTAYDNVYAFDESLTKTTPDGLSMARAYLSAASVGNYALFAGGNGKDSQGLTVRSIVDAYQVA